MKSAPMADILLFSTLSHQMKLAINDCVRVSLLVAPPTPHYSESLFVPMLSESVISAGQSYDGRFHRQCNNFCK